MKATDGPIDGGLHGVKQTYSNFVYFNTFDASDYNLLRLLRVGQAIVNNTAGLQYISNNASYISPTP